MLLSVDLCKFKRIFLVSGAFMNRYVLFRVPSLIRLISAAVFMFLMADFAPAKSKRVRVRPAWMIEQAPCRISFVKGADDFILTEVPVVVSNYSFNVVSAFAGGRKLKSDLVFDDGQTLKVLIDVGAVAAHGRVDLYLIQDDNPAQLLAPVIKDSTPLHGSVGRTAGMDYPGNRMEVDSLTTRFDRATTSFKVGSFDQLGGTFTNWYRGDWRRKSHLVDLNTWILIPSNGRFVFGLAGVSPVWLKVDKQENMVHPPDQTTDKWTVGKPVNLKAGLHQLQARILCRQKIDTCVAWKREGQDGMAEDVTMLTGVDLSKGRLEWSDRSVHPFFRVAAGQAYRFCGTEGGFVPFNFIDRSVCWSGNYQSKWKIDGVSLGTGKSIEKCLPAISLPAKAGLTLTAIESGECAEYSAVIDYKGPVWHEYEISSRISSLQAACYSDDKVHPIVRVKTTADDRLEYTLNSEIELVAGKKIECSKTIYADQGMAQCYLDELKVGDVKRIAWSLTHCGCELTSGELLFKHNPVDFVPDDISGELFKSGDDFVVVVVSKHSAEQKIRESTLKSDHADILFMDGFVYDGYRGPQIIPGVSQGRQWQWIGISELESCERRSGTSVLQIFTKLNQALAADIVLYAPSLSCISREGSPDGFERRLSAMCSLLTNSAGNSPRVILVVPPNYNPIADSMPATGLNHNLDARLIAEIVMRIADVYGLETADLYSAFEIAGNQAADGQSLVRGGAMTKAGCSFAHDIIMRKL